MADTEVVDEGTEDELLVAPPNKGILKTSPSVEVLVNQKWNEFQTDQCTDSIKPPLPDNFFQFMNYLYTTQQPTARVGESTRDLPHESLQDDIPDGDKKQRAKTKGSKLTSKETKDTDSIHDDELVGESESKSILQPKRKQLDFDDSASSDEDSLPPSSHFNVPLATQKEQVVSKPKRKQAPCDDSVLSDSEYLPPASIPKKDKPVEKKRKKVAREDSVLTSSKKSKQNSAEKTNLPKVQKASTPKSAETKKAKVTIPKIPKKKTIIELKDTSDEEEESDDSSVGEKAVSIVTGSGKKKARRQRSPKESTPPFKYITFTAVTAIADVANIHYQLMFYRGLKREQPIPEIGRVHEVLGDGNSGYYCLILALLQRNKYPLDFQPDNKDFRRYLKTEAGKLKEQFVAERPLWKKLTSTQALKVTKLRVRNISLCAVNYSDPKFMFEEGNDNGTVIYLNDMNWMDHNFMPAMVSVIFKLIVRIYCKKGTKPMRITEHDGRQGEFKCTRGPQSMLPDPKQEIIAIYFDGYRFWYIEFPYVLQKPL